MTNLQKGITILLKITLAIIFLIASTKMPYKYYEFVRVAGFLGFIILAYIDYSQSNSINKGEKNKTTVTGPIWRNAVEAGAKAIEVTGEIIDGVNATIEHLKDQDWYENLSQDDKERFAKELEAHYNSAGEEHPSYWENNFSSKLFALFWLLSAIIINPLKKVVLHKEYWVIIDISLAVVLLISVCLDGLRIYNTKNDN